MVDYTEDLNYASNRLTETVVMLRGQPVYVRGVEGNGIAPCMEIPTQNRINVRLRDLDLTPIPLGYVNEERNCHYLMRIPARQWRQGLRTSQISCSTGWSRHYSPVRSSGFFNSVINNFPSPSECYEGFVNEECESRAFSRNFALLKTDRRNNSMNLSYKGRVVGTAIMGDSRITTALAPKFTYLSELLEEERHGRP